MKQVIRIETFETNSSSYHSISIRKKSDADKEVLEEIEFGKVTTLTGTIKYKTIGYTESYCFTSRTKLDKANMLCRYISAQMDDLIYDLPGYDEISNIKDDEERKEARRQLGLNHPLFSALVKAIKNYTKADVKFDFKANDWNDWFYPVWGEDADLYDIIGTKETENEDVLVEAYTKVIFDDDLEIIEECESNE